MSPKFSVIIPLYNKAPYVRKALESVMLQTYSDFELIIVDDGSSDNSLEIVREFVGRLDNKWKDDRLTIISQSNSGVAAARNKGVKESEGEYVCFLDADDWWSKDFLKVMDEATKICPNAGIYGVNYFSVRKGVSRQVLEGIPTGIINYFKKYYHPPYAMPLWTGAVVIPRKVYDEIGGFNNELKMAEDFDLWTRIALKYPVYYTDKVMAYYNQDVQVKWRAIGKLVEPKYHFVFHADYLLSEMEMNEDLRHAVDMVKIVCLKQYYLSNQYYQLARSELHKIRLDEYRDKYFATYIWEARWKVQVKQYVYALVKSIRNR